ncbi:hypothetical protein [Streptomyces aidingensis]|uniref:N-acetyltransferase domain-containing protein n=1 Tax=Streptomyces aidingensis TaxID=910347 RepID=A0A1I1N1E3_9ACTN|nr:hypothetical protein [Streptomyces aidingensis]SFC88663.1 hypothetical protein SAMN05421773_10754 [Streptomyces aidingensis]
MTPTAHRTAPPAEPDTAPDTAPRWSGRPRTPEDTDAVLAMFTEPDFYYRTDRPDTRSEAEILRLLDDDTRLLLADGRPAGLYAVQAAGAEHGCHYQVELRLTGEAPLAWWVSAYRELVRALRWEREVVRIALPLHEFDDRGRRFARAAGLTEEGTLAQVTARGGGRHGRVFFARIFPPERKGAPQ